MEENMDIKVLVATHKNYWMPDDDMYIPLHVGREGKEDLGFTGDNTGDNISLKNPNYCELTGLYWAWKNLNCDYIGLCHYRRYFGKQEGNNSRSNIINCNDVERMIRQFEIVLPKKMNFYFQSVEEQYAMGHYLKDLRKTRDIINDIYPEYSLSFNKIMASHKLYCCNMFIAKKEVIDEYLEWLFAILFKLEKCTDLTDYSDYNKRIYGFISERLFNVWLDYKKLSIIELPIVNLEDESSFLSQIKCIAHSIRYKLYKKRSEIEWLKSTSR